MSIFATVVSLPNRPASERVQRTIENTADSIDAGRDSDFALGCAEISIRIDGGVALVSCVRSDWERDAVAILRTVAVRRGGDRNWQVVRSGGVVVAETYALTVAVGTALEYVGAAALAGVQHEHDNVSV